MKNYEQGGADFDGKKTKAALKKAVKENPDQVYLYSTTAIPTSEPKWSGKASELPEDLTFNVVGPDPYTARNWYASVARNAKGELTVK